MGSFNAWGYQLDFANFFNNGLTIIPNENLISNIGFRADATHTLDESSIYANMPVVEIDEITHPVFVLPQKQADMVVLTRDFNLEEKRRRNNKFSKRLKRMAKSMLKQAASFMFLS